MPNNTVYRPIERALTLHNAQGHPVTIQGKTLAITIGDTHITECRLTLEVTAAQYNKQIDPQAMFHLEPAVRGPMMFAETFISDEAIRLECRLGDDYLPLLTEQAVTIEEMVDYLATLPSQQPDHPLLATESWFGLSVKQAQGAVKVGYTANTASSIKPRLVENGAALSPQTDAESDVAGPLSAVLEEFFQADNWPYTKVSADVYNCAFEGKNGQFICYAQVREEDSQVVFYSVLTITVPQDRLQTTAEFVTRANYGMIIGNFELDWRDGEVRYKTSIDVENDRLTLALVKNLVYPNVMMMDRYLPGIMQVVYGDTTPSAAIAMIES